MFGSATTPRGRRRALGAGIVLALLSGLMPLPGPAAAAASSITVQGTVRCQNGKAVTGVWVESSTGGSRWATWKAMGSAANATYKATVSVTSTPTTIRLHVGCGGTAQSWWSTNLTPTIKITRSVVLNTFCREAAGKAQRCVWPTKGSTRSTNPGYAGYCTWGAAEKFRQYTGYYPAVSGDAAKWAASNGGFTVTSVPMAKSIVIFPATSTNSFGHVAWVDSVAVGTGGKVTLNITEMNYGPNFNPSTGKTDNFNKYTTRTLEHTSSLRYLVAPLPASR